MNEIEGIVSMNGGMAEGLAERIGRKILTKGVSAEVGEKEVVIDLKVIIEYGTNVPDLYQKISSAVKKAIKNMTGLQVAKVNMHVEGIKVRDELH